MKSKDIVIIGGGISGLSTAYFISKNLKNNNLNTRCTLIEKSDQFGGKIKTVHNKGFTIESGPDSFAGYKIWGTQLVKELGLSSELIPQNSHPVSTYIYHKDKLRKLPSGLTLMGPIRINDVLTNDLLSLKGKLRLLTSIFTKNTNKEDSPLTDYVTKKFGKEALEMIAEPLLANIYRSDPLKMSIDGTFPQLRKIKLTIPILNKNKNNPASFLSFRNGMGSLTDKITLKLKENSVSLLSKKDLKKILEINGKYRLIFSDKSELIADIVILAIPSFEAMKLLTPICRKTEKILKKIPYSSLINISLGFREKDIPSLPGNGFLIPNNSKQNISACTFTSSKFSYRSPSNTVLLRCFLKSSKSKDHSKLSDDKLVDLVKKDLEETVNITSKPIFYKVFRLENATPQYEIGHLERISALEKALNKHPGLFITGASYRGVGIPDCIHQAEIVSEQVLQYIKN